MLSDKILHFLFHLRFPLDLPEEISVLNPFTEAGTRQVAEQFYQKFYGDDERRYCIIGINPGRFGGGVTGVPFTDPIRLQQVCNIPTTLAPKQELSSAFMYQMIKAYGGATEFYKQFYITSVSPLGFTAKGKNLNYYDDKNLLSSIAPFAAGWLQTQLSWPLQKSTAFCLGEGKNFQFLQKLNAVHHFFDKLVPLPHPRFIMQYKLATKDAYIDRYIEQLKTTVSKGF